VLRGRCQACPSNTAYEQWQLQQHEVFASTQGKDAVSGKQQRQREQR
jgi:hypothetical protein